jgi:hypothetical protein
MLQLLYSGGTFDVVQNGALGTASGVPQLVMPLTPYNVLRRTDRSQPIFRLTAADLDDPAGSSSNQYDSQQKKILAVRFLMLDNNTRFPSDQQGGANTDIYRISGAHTARWYETTIPLRGLDRN